MAARLPVVAPLPEALDDDFGCFVVVRVVWLETVGEHEVVNVVPSSVPDDTVVCSVVLDLLCCPIKVVMGRGSPLAGGPAVAGASGAMGARRRGGCG